MSKLGRYEFVLQKALEQLGPGPWDSRDLKRAEDVLTQDFCLAIDRECDKAAVFDWLSALQAQDVPDLLRRLNASAVKGQGNETA
jgi:hypothetical protein